MGIQFAKLMGNIKEIEISFSTTATGLGINFSTYSNTAQHLIQSLEEVSELISTINNKNILEIKEKFKNILQINKNELSQPLKTAKKFFDQTEKNLNKISEKIKHFNEKSQQTSLDTTSKSKIILKPEENIALEHAISELSHKLNSYKQRLDILFDNLMTIQDKTNDIKKAISLYDYTNEETKLSKHIAYFANKLQYTRYHQQTTNTNRLLTQLKTLEVSIMQSGIINTPCNTNTITSEQSSNSGLSSQSTASSSQDHHATLLTQFEKSISSINPTNNSENDANLVELADQENSLDSTNSINDLLLTTLFNPTMSPRISPRQSV